MDKKEIKSKLEMLDIYFPEYSFKYDKKQGPINLTTGFNIDYAEKTDDRFQVRILINTLIKDEEDRFELKLSTLGFFKLNAEDIEENVADYILKKNTVAMMFPFIRSQISLLTTQPGMTPILLQPIDVDALVDNVLK